MPGPGRDASSGTGRVRRSRLLVALVVFVALVAGVVVVRRGIDDRDVADGGEVLAGTTTTSTSTAIAGTGSGGAGDGSSVTTLEPPGADVDPLIVDLPTDVLATIDGEAMAVERVCRSSGGALVYEGPGDQRVELGDIDGHQASLRLTRGDHVGDAGDVRVSDHGAATLYKGQVTVAGTTHAVVALDTGHMDDAGRCD